MNNSNLLNFSKKLPVGINGGDLITADFNGNNYIAMISLSGKIKLFSEGSIDSRCIQQGSYYVTELNFEDVSDVYSEKLYAKYNDTIYEVGMIGKNYSSIELLARKDFINEDLKLGFAYNREFDVTNKFVSIDDIAGIVSDKISIYADLLKKNKIIK